MAVDLSELEKRLEQATGPDGALDLAVHEACGSEIVWTERTYQNWLGEERDERNWHIRGATGLAKPVTASLDAAVALVERCLPHSDWKLEKETAVKGAMFEASLWRGMEPGVLASGRASIASAPSAALALCLALIRALRHPR